MAYASEHPAVVLPDNVRAVLGGNLAGTIRQISQIAGSCIDSARALEKNTAAPESEEAISQAWQKSISSSAQGAMKQMGNAVDADGDKTIDYFTQLPPEQQDGAAGEYTGAMSIVNAAIHAIMLSLGSLTGAVDDFMAGNWSRIDAVRAEVDKTCKEATQNIADLFGPGVVGKK